MSYRQIIQETWRKNFLFSVMIELTYGCNLECAICYNDRSKTGLELSPPQYRKLFADLKSLNTLQVTFTGGEPLTHPHFFTIGGFARELGFLVRIKSNGHAMSPPVIERLKEEIDPFVVELSLHGAQAKTHDRQTRVPGSFKKLMYNLENLRNAGLRTKLSSVLTSWNEDELEAMFELARNLELRLQFDPQVTPNDNGTQAAQEFIPSKDGLRRLLTLQAQHLKTLAGSEPPAQGKADENNPGDTIKHCGAGSSSLHIDPFGDVYPCVQWRRRLGNLHENGISDIWKSSKKLREVRRQSKDVSRILKANNGGQEISGFCPGLAELITGNPSTLYQGFKDQLEAQPKRSD